MKIKLTILTLFISFIGLVHAQSVTFAMDNEFEIQKQRVWSAIQTHKPDYYASNKSARSSQEVWREFLNNNAHNKMAANNTVKQDVYYSEVDHSGTSLVDQQNEFIFTSMEEEKVLPVMDWSSDLGKTMVENIFPKAKVHKQLANISSSKKYAQPLYSASQSQETDEVVTKQADLQLPAEVNKDVEKAKVKESFGDKLDNPDVMGKENKGIWGTVSSIFKRDSESSGKADANKGKQVDSSKASQGSAEEIEKIKKMKKILKESKKEPVVLDENVQVEIPVEATVEEEKNINKEINPVSEEEVMPMPEIVIKQDTADIKLAALTKEEDQFAAVQNHGIFENAATNPNGSVQKMVDTFTEEQNEWIQEVDEKTEPVETKVPQTTQTTVGEEESFWKKVERKFSMSGMTKEEVAELEYWEVPVQEQTVDDISRNLKIDAAFEEAANIKLPEVAPKNDEMVEPEEELIVTATDIIRKVIPKNNLNKKLDLDFDDTNLSDILLIIGETGKINIVLDPVLKNNTLDLHLKQIRLEDALLLVANSYDLGFKLVGNALFITEKDKLKFENKVSKVIKVRNINVEEAKLLVDDLVDTVNASEELNSLIVIGDPEAVSKVEKIVGSIDRPQPQVILEAKIIEVNKDALKDLGVDWADQINLRYQESGRPQDFDDVENSSSSFYRIAQIQRNPLQFETTIRMLEQQNKAKVLSAPRVTTLNGKEAEIFVGDEVPYTITNITGGVVTNDVRFVEPGIRLRITPSIIEEEFVVMKVEPEVSFIVTFRGPNDEFPQVRTREATAHVRINNKTPFVLGGILNQEDKQSLFKVPFFGKLPLFGNLFSYEKNTAVDTELIITIIPTIVNGQY